jgi:hypothetical protein
VTHPARLAAWIMLAGISAPLAAQAQDDPVRLDDLAVSPSADQSLEVQQLSTGAAQTAQAPQPRDRTVATAERSAPPAPSVAQLTQSGKSAEQAQLSQAGASPDQSSAAVSSPTQSRPEGVERLAGADRCDPQLANAAGERCRHILELRAHEFHAPAPPQLSSEEKLLAEQRAAEEVSTHSPDTRIRLASKEDPDAESKSNQELAALYLESQSAPPEKPTDKSAPAVDETLAKVLEAFQIGGSPSQGGQ